MRQDIENDYWPHSKQEAKYQDTVRNYLRSINIGIGIIWGLMLAQLIATVTR